MHECLRVNQYFYTLFLNQFIVLPFLFGVIESVG
uniref:Iron-sulfur cluster assembly protein n=1 Tax=Rhizophora mucronata TaxID=61149 RepID=A0A2P2JHL5_RHIMU